MVTSVVDGRRSNVDREQTHLPVAVGSASQRIVLADSQVLFVDTLSFALRNAGHNVVATADSCASLRRAIEAHRPEICVTDDSFPDGSVTELMAGLRDSRGCRFVMLTANSDASVMRSALDAGVLGFVHKTRGISVLLDIVRRVANEEVVVEGSFSRRPSRSDDVSVSIRQLAEYLTERERECLSMLVTGLNTRAIAARLGISQTTVRSHVQAVLTKLGVHSRLEAAALAVRHGLCDGLRSADAQIPLNSRNSIASAV